MWLIGGDMGVLNSKSTKNVTLLYPNLVMNNSSVIIKYHQLRFSTLRIDRVIARLIYVIEMKV